MKNDPLVSVVMPVYNAEKFLPQAIESILNQTYKNFEFIIIDDCSTDRSQDIIKKYAKKDKRIKYFINKKNLNQSKTIAKSLRLIKGKYFFKMDNDDVSDKDRLLEQIKFLEENKDYIIVGSNIRIIDENNNLLGCRYYPISDKEIKKTLFFKSPFAYPSICIRTDILKKIKYPTIFNFCDDYLLWFKLKDYGKYANLSKFLLNYRITKNQVKFRNLKTQLKETIEVQKIIFDHSKKIPIFAYINHFLLKILYFFPNRLVYFLFRVLEYKK